jgi:hypothetical protein
MQKKFGAMVCFCGGAVLPSREQLIEDQYPLISSEGWVNVTF